MGQLKVENNERIAAIKFVNSYESATPLSAAGDNVSGGSSSMGKAHQFLLIAHSDKVSVLSAKDNFTRRHTFKLGEAYSQQMQMLRLPDQHHLQDQIAAGGVDDPLSEGE